MKVVHLSSVSENKGIPRILLTCLVAVLIIAVSGCQDNDKELQAKIRKAEAEQQARIYMDKLRAKVACESAGGIVITDNDGNMINCVFKPRP